MDSWLMITTVDSGHQTGQGRAGVRLLSVYFVAQVDVNINDPLCCSALILVQLLRPPFLMGHCSRPVSYSSHPAQYEINSTNISINNVRKEKGEITETVEIE